VREHTGTHINAPVHWVTGKDVANGSVDTIDPVHFIAPVCVIDCSRDIAADPDFLLTPAVLESWENEHGRITPGCWLFLRSDWSKIAAPDNYTKLDENGTHSPGPDAAAVQWMIGRGGVEIGCRHQCGI